MTTTSESPPKTSAQNTENSAENIDPNSKDPNSKDTNSKDTKLQNHSGLDLAYFLLSSIFSSEYMHSNRSATHMSAIALTAVITLLQTLVLLHNYAVSALGYAVVELRGKYDGIVILDVDVYVGVFNYVTSPDACSFTETMYVIEDTDICSSPRIMHECKNWFLDDNEKNMFSNLCSVCSDVMPLSYYYFAAHVALSLLTMHFLFIRIDLRKDTQRVRTMSFMTSVACVYGGMRGRALVNECLGAVTTTTLHAFDSEEARVVVKQRFAGGVVMMSEGVAWIVLGLVVGTRAVSGEERGRAIGLAMGMKMISVSETGAMMAGKLGTAQAEMAKARADMKELRKSLKQKASVVSANNDVSTSPDTSLETLLKLPNAVLKERLRDYGVAAQGRKQALAEQLREAMLQSPAASEGAGGDQPNPTTANADLDGITSDSPPTNDPCPPSPPLNAKFSDLPPPLKDYFKTSLSSNSLTPIQQQVFGSYLDQTTVIDSVPFIVHAPTGSGKTLAYILPLLSSLGLYAKKPLRKPLSNALIITPTTELAFQVGDVIKNLLKSAQMTGQCQIDVKMSVISPPQNVQLLANSAPSMTLLPSTTMPDALTCTIFVASAKTIHASLTKSAGGISPTPPPHVSMFYQRIGFLVLDEVDRLLLTKKKHEKRQAPPTTVAITHEKPAAVVAANILKWRGGKVTVVGASATVGRRVRREFCRILGLPYMDPTVLMTGSQFSKNDDFELSEVDDEDNEDEVVENGRLVKIPSTVKHFYAPVEAATGGGQLASAARVTQLLSEDGPKKILIVLTKSCGLTVKHSVGALKFMSAKPNPIALVDFLMETRDGDKKDEFLCVTSEDTVRGLDLDLNTVILVGKATGPDSYVHAAGRCGRAGKKGSVVSIVGYEEGGRINGWRNMLGIEFHPVEVEDVKTAGV